MFKRSLTIAMSLLLFTFAFYTAADAQVQKVTFHVDAFLCNKALIIRNDKSQKQHHFHTGRE